MSAQITTDAGTTTRPAARLTSLDGLRGVAAMVVVLHHVLFTDRTLALPYSTAPALVSRREPEWWLLYTPLHLLWDGPEAVMVFFVLSGYVLALPAARGRRSSWRAYYPKRLIRLYLPTWAAVGLALALIDAGLTGAGRPTFGLVLHDLTLTQGPGVTNVALWSLEWEVLFSLLLPVFVLVGSLSRGRRRRALIVVLLLLVMVYGGARGHASLLFLPMFALGTLMAFAREESARLGAAIDGSRRATAVWWGLALVCAVLLEGSWAVSVASAASATGASSRATALAHLCEVAGAVLTVFLAGTWAAARQALQRPSIAWLGTRSFSLYLVHDPIVLATTRVLGGRPPLALTLLVAVPLALFCTEVFFRLVEQPSLRLARATARRVA